jgi:hypothetical protein
MNAMPGRLEAAGLRVFIRIHFMERRTCPQEPSIRKKPLPSLPRETAPSGHESSHSKLSFNLQHDAGNQAMLRFFESGATPPDSRIAPPNDKDEQKASLHTPSVSSGLLQNLGPGRPLDPPVRETMESQFGHDFRSVRVHEDSRAADAAHSVSARAFNLGSHIAFGQGQYTPETRDGRLLLAHELVHVVQQGKDASPVLRRSRQLNAAEQFGTSGNKEKDIDKAIADSPVSKYMTKDWRTLTGNVETSDPHVFEKEFERYGKSDEDTDFVPGFVNRAEKQPIKLRNPGKSGKGGKEHIVAGATVEAAVHETIHLNSSELFQQIFGHNCNEGVTQHFTTLVLGVPGKAYPDELKLAEGLMTALGADGEDRVGDAFFRGKAKELHQSIEDSFNKNGIGTEFMAWRAAAAKKPPDWKKANQLMEKGLKPVKPSGAKTAAPAGGSGQSKPSPPSE